MTDQKTYSETATDTLATQVNVPPGKKYQYHVMVEYGKVNVPYEAQLTFQSVAPGTVPVHLTTKGIFTGVNSTNSDIIVVDVTSSQPQQQTLVARTPVTAGSAELVPQV